MALRLTAILLLISQLQLGLSAQLDPQQRLIRRNHQHALQKRGQGKFSGRATFYDPGLGACGGTNGPTDYIVALNQAQYQSNSWCNKQIEVFFGGKTHTATIVDECPGCPFGGLDMSPALFEFFASKDVGVLYMSWSLTDGSSDQPDPAPKPAPPPPSPPPPPPPPPPKKEDPPPPPPPSKDPAQPPDNDPVSTPPKKEDPSPPKDNPPKKDDLSPPEKNDIPPPYTPTPATSFGSASNPFTAFQSNSNLPAAAAAAPLVSQPNTSANISPSTATTIASPGPIANSLLLQPNSQANPYSPGGNLDAINQLVISFGSLTAASAGNALDKQS